MIELLKAADADDIVVFGGGIIPEEDHQALYDMGVKGIFTPGTRMDEVSTGCATRSAADRTGLTG